MLMLVANYLLCIESFALDGDFKLRKNLDLVQHSRLGTPSLSALAILQLMILMHGESDRHLQFRNK